MSIALRLVVDVFILACWKVGFCPFFLGYGNPYEM